MANKDNTAVRRGYLTLHRNPGGRFPLSTLSSKRMWMVLCREAINGMGRPRIEMYRSEDNVSGYQPLRVIDLETVRSVQPVERKKGFLIELLDETMMLQCTSKADMEDWVRDLNRLRGGIDLASGQNVTEGPAGQDIYEVVPDDEVFRVKLRKSNSLRFSGQCLLEILRDFDRNLFHIALFTEDEPPRLIVKWQIDHIRQYGSNNIAFKFQSGSKSPTGVDWFILDTDNGAAVRVHRSVDYWAKHIVDQIKNIHGTRVRAPSAPSSRTPPSRPPRPTVTHTSSVDPITRPSQGTYAPLSATSREQPAVYQEISVPKSGAKKSVLKQSSSGEGAMSTSGGGVYQALGNNKDAPSTYARVNIGQGGGAQNSPTSDHATYMGLQPDTRQASQNGPYAFPDRK